MRHSIRQRSRKTTKTRGGRPYRKRQSGGFICKSLRDKKISRNYSGLNFAEKLIYQSCKHVFSRKKYKKSRALLKAKNIEEYDLLEDRPQPRENTAQKNTLQAVKNDPAIKLLQGMSKKDQEYFAKELNGLNGFDADEILSVIRS